MLNPQPSASDSVDLLQQQYQASSTIFGSHDPVESLEALVNFLAGGFARAELGLVDAEDPALIQILAQMDGSAVRESNFTRQNFCRRHQPCYVKRDTLIRWRLNSCPNPLIAIAQPRETHATPAPSHLSQQARNDPHRPSPPASSRTNQRPGSRSARHVAARD